MAPKLCLTAITTLILSSTVAGIEESGVKATLAAREALGTPAPAVTWWCADDSPWRPVDNASTGNCTQLVTIRDASPPSPCPSYTPPPPCPPAAPIIPTIDAGKDLPASNEQEKDARDMANIEDFCHKLQDQMPLKRPNDTYSAYINLQQKGWRDPPSVDTKVSVKILHEIHRDFGQQVSEAFSEPRFLNKYGVCDRTHEEQTRYDACVGSVHGLWERKTSDMGGYKSWPDWCTLYDWEPRWPAGQEYEGYH